MKSVILGGGKGYGESILLQVKEDEYGIIDSFIDTDTGNPCVIDYLIENKIEYSKIKFVLLTHYHQDHYSGMSKILELCQEAVFFASKSINSPSFHFLISAYSHIESTHNFFKEFEGIVNILRSTNRKINVLSDTSSPIYKDDENAILSLSPNEDAIEFLDNQYKIHARQLTDSPGIKLLLGANFNFQSVVVVYDNKKCRSLYGSDLEHHPLIPNMGWDRIYETEKFREGKVRLFKIPHHGSENGCNQQKWEEFLEDSSILNLTPYSRGSRLPKIEMVERINDISENSFITSKITSSKVPTKFKKKLEGLNIRFLKGKRGVIESVSSGDADDMKIQLHGSAINLKDFK